MKGTYSYQESFQMLVLMITQHEMYAEKKTLRFFQSLV